MLGFRDDGDYERAMEILQHADYTEAAVGRVVGQEQILSIPSNAVPRVLRRTRGLSRLDTLIRLFYLGCRPHRRRLLGTRPHARSIPGSRQDSFIPRTATARWTRESRFGR